MRPATLTSLLFVVLGYAANAQKFSLLPQVGLENNFTSLSLNNLNSFSPMGGQLSPRASLRLDYQFMKNQGVYLAASTSRSVINFEFTNPEAALTSFNASQGNMQVRLEGGYKLNTKPIYLSKSKTIAQPAKTTYQKMEVRNRCGGTSYYYKRVTQQSPPVIEKGSYVSIQPNIGAAYIPGVRSDMNVKSNGAQNVYEYRAGNWNTAVVGGASLEFGRNDIRKFVITVQYLKGLGHLNTNTITTVSNGKESVSTLDSKSSGWNLTAGIPISLSKKKPMLKAAVAPAESKKSQPQNQQRKCGQYKSHCGRSI